MLQCPHHASIPEETWHAAGSAFAIMRGMQAAGIMLLGVRVVTHSC